MIGDAWGAMTYGAAFLAGVFLGAALGMWLLGTAIFIAYRVAAKTWHGLRYLFALEDGVST